MTSSLTSSKGRDRCKSFLASAEATFTFSADADAVVVLCLIAEQSVIVDVGTWFLMTRFYMYFITDLLFKRAGSARWFWWRVLTWPGDHAS